MKTTLAKVLVTSLLFSVAVSSVIQGMYFEEFKDMCDSAREGIPLTFKLGEDGEIVFVEAFDEKNSASVFVLIENFLKDSRLFEYEFVDEDYVSEKRPLMEAIIEGHGKRGDRLGQELSNLTIWIRDTLRIEIPTALILLIVKYFPSYHIHKQNSALIEQVKTMREGRVNELRKTIKAGGIDLNKPLRDATFHHHPEIVALLLESKADTNACRKFGVPLLLHALRYDNLEIAELLIRDNADVHYQDRSGFTDLLCVVRDCNLQAVKLLLESEADVNHVNYYGEGALGFAKKFSDEPEKFLDGPEIIKLLQSNQAMGLSKEAIYEYSVEDLRKLIESSDVDLNKKINDFTPLGVATCCRRPEVVDLLLKNDADPNLCGNYNDSPPLYEAVDTQIARLLIVGKADVAQTNCNKRTALSEATDLRNSAMIKLLQSPEKIRSEI